MIITEMQAEKIDIAVIHVKVNNHILGKKPPIILNVDFLRKPPLDHSAYEFIYGIMMGTYK